MKKGCYVLPGYKRIGEVDHGYKVVRTYFNRPRVGRTIIERCTLAEAQEHCENPETSSSTCRSSAKKSITQRNGPWFDCYYKL